MAKRDIVVVGASAGGVEALKQLASGLPADLAAAVFVVLHLPSNGVSALPRILNRYGALPAETAHDGEPIQLGRIYVGPPDVHLVLKRDRVVLSGAPRENGFRPAIDPLFRSAARAFGPRVIGIVLSGTGDDGTLGLLAIKDQGGAAIVQSPEDALFSAMPTSALEAVDVDFCLPVGQIAAKLVELVGQDVPEIQEETESIPMGSDLGSDLTSDESIAVRARNGKMTDFTCPECGGPLREVQGEKYTRYQCFIGHVFSPERLMLEKTEALEHALWSAVRALEERTDLARRLARRMRKADCPSIADRFDEQERQSDEAARLIRQVLLSGMISNRDVPDDDLGSPGTAAG